MQSGIYRILNLNNGHCYIGSAVRLSVRLKHHRNALDRGDHRSIVLQRAWNLHGEIAFSFHVLFICHKEMLLFYEQRAINAFAPEYKICKTAGSRLGARYSDEARARPSALRKAQPRSAAQLQHIANLAERKRGTAGPKHSEATKVKLRIAATGVKQSEEIRRKKSAATKGRPKSEEHKAKIAAAHRGKKRAPFTQQHREAIAAASRGRKLSPESIAKMAASKRGKKLRPEIREARRARKAAKQLKLDM